MKKKFLILLICLCSCIPMFVFANSFGDLASDHWAFEYINNLTNDGIINGYPEDNTFRPENTISRAEFLKLVIAASLPEGVSIDEIPMAIDHWAGRYLYVAETYGIIQRDDITLENINEPITRVEMALMVSKSDVILKFSDLNTENPILFSDYDKLNSEEVRWLTHSVNKGYLTGYPDNTFGPEKNMTRAEAATVIYRYTR